MWICDFNSCLLFTHLLNPKRAATTVVWGEIKSNV